VDVIFDSGFAGDVMLATILRPDPKQSSRFSQPAYDYLGTDITIFGRKCTVTPSRDKKFAPFTVIGTEFLSRSGIQITKTATGYLELRRFGIFYSGRKYRPFGAKGQRRYYQ
jgi:hypothetical protein